MECIMTMESFRVGGSYLRQDMPRDVVALQETGQVTAVYYVESHRR
jgi:hypothetical protein